tara:strand:- start:63 stop:602 length:540 start_codon:yes stop_codon:yes gene_type:complete
MFYIGKASSRQRDAIWHLGFLRRRIRVYTLELSAASKRASHFASTLVLGMQKGQKRTPRGAVLTAQAVAAMADYQNAQLVPHTPLEIQVQGLQYPPDAPPIVALVLGTPGSSQQEPSQQESSSSATDIVGADVANAAGPSSSGQAQVGQEGPAELVVEDQDSPMSEESGMTSIRTDDLN